MSQQHRLTPNALQQQPSVPNTSQQLVPLAWPEEHDDSRVLEYEQYEKLRRLRELRKRMQAPWKYPDAMPEFDEAALISIMEDGEEYFERSNSSIVTNSANYLTDPAANYSCEYMQSNSNQSLLQQPSGFSASVVGQTPPPTPPDSSSPASSPSCLAPNGLLASRNQMTNQAYVYQSQAQEVAGVQTEYICQNTIDDTALSTSNSMEISSIQSSHREQPYSLPNMDETVSPLTTTPSISELNNSQEQAPQPAPQGPDIEDRFKSLHILVDAALGNKNYYEEPQYCEEHQQYYYTGHMDADYDEAPRVLLSL